MYYNFVVLCSSRNYLKRKVTVSRNTSSEETESSGWGFVLLMAFASILCCGGPLLLGAVGIVGVAWIGGLSLGAIALLVFVLWRVRWVSQPSRRSDGFGSSACCATQVNEASVD